MSDLQRVRNGKVIEELLKVVWGGTWNLFIHLNNRRIQENKERDTKLGEGSQRNQKS